MLSVIVLVSETVLSVASELEFSGELDGSVDEGSGVLPLPQPVSRLIASVTIRSNASDFFMLYSLSVRFRQDQSGYAAIV
jgi:hypothetical protein